MLLNPPGFCGVIYGCNSEQPDADKIWSSRVVCDCTKSDWRVAEMGEEPGHGDVGKTREIPAQSDVAAQLS